MSEKFTRIEGPGGEKIIVRKPMLIDLLPSPKEVAKEAMGLDDNRTNVAWLYGENGKAPR